MVGELERGERDSAAGRGGRERESESERERLFHSNNMYYSTYSHFAFI